MIGGLSIIYKAWQPGQQAPDLVNLLRLVEKQRLPFVLLELALQGLTWLFTATLFATTNSHVQLLSICDEYSLV